MVSKIKSVFSNSLDVATAKENINNNIKQTAPSATKTNVHYYDLFRTIKMSLRTLAMIFVWTVGGLSYFGINQYVSFLGSSVYISVIILGLIQVSIYLFTITLISSFSTLDYPSQQLFYIWYSCKAFFCFVNLCCIEFQRP